MQQQGDVPKLTFNVGYPQNNGNPTTEDVCTFFRDKGLDVKGLSYPNTDEIQFRGLVRNRQIQGSSADWMLFADTDMTYDPLFFADLGRQLLGDLKNERRVMSAHRVSLEKKHCIDYFNVANDPHKYPCVIEKAGELQDWPIFKISRSCGAGYFQLVNRIYVMEKFGWYVNPAKCNDRSWKIGHKTRSDQQFKRMLGGIKRIQTRPQYHLNHIRDNELGYHTEEQR